MDCKDTSIKLRGGYTLVELMVAMGVSGVVLLSVLTTFVFHSRAVVSILGHATMGAESQRAKDILSQRIRQADRLTSYSTTNLIFADFDQNPIQFAYDASAKTLSLTKTNATTVLLKNCTALDFQIFQRTVASNSLDVLTAAVPTNCKVVQVRWTSKIAVNSVTNVENMECAKIVLRKN